MKKLFTLLAVAAMAITAQAEVNYIHFKAPTTESTDAETGEVKLTAANLPAETVLFDNDYVKGVTVFEAKTGINNEYVFPGCNETFTDWFEFRSKKFGEGAFPGEQDGSNRTQVILTVKEATTFYCFVRTGNNKHIVVFNESGVEVTRASENLEIDPTSESNAFFSSSWELAAGNYVLTETGGTGRCAGFGYEANSSAIENIAVDANAPVEYFNLQGLRVNNPENGLYIRRQGNKVSKVIL